ncbi:MAG TPA: D-glycero-beta-D-manno-heptose 1-phosphate adenylyltransferase [Ktedonobacteraceae bacterium]|nr:D-glycero-beta-D-manno-heptose 1-phosphate adenylyltransferase [Ktedonobacteraceae bacterium]
MTTAVDLVRRFRQLRVLVIGDAMLDTYLEGSAARLCSEGPVPVVRKTAEQRHPGGAANTAANLRALDASVVFLSIIGRDFAGSLLRSALCERGVSDEWLVEDEQASTLHKMRILADGQYVVRFDDEETHACSPASQQQLLARLDAALPSCDVVVVSDYCYGVISDELIERLKVLRTAYPCPLLIDSKDLYRFRDAGATVITPNHLEARLLAQYRRIAGKKATDTRPDLAEMERIGRQLLALIDTEYVAITMAGDGVFLIDRQQRALHLPAHPVQYASDIGAGDSFAAAMALALGAGASVEDAARIGIDAASIAITKRGTAVVQYQELLQRVSLHDHALNSRTQIPTTEIDSLLALTQLIDRLETERRAGKTIVFTNGVFDILHAGHVQFLKGAKQLGDVLVVAVNSDSSTRRLKGRNRPINSERDRLALVAALDPVDYVLLFDDDNPSGLIRALRPHIHVKGGDYADEVLPEEEAVREVGGRIVILPLAGNLSTSRMIDRIVALAGRNVEALFIVPDGEVPEA